MRGTVQNILEQSGNLGELSSAVYFVSTHDEMEAHAHIHMFTDKWNYTAVNFKPCHEPI